MSSFDDFSDRLVDGWDRFFFTETSTGALGVFRILFALALWWEVSVTRAKSLFAIEGGFHLPYLSFIPHVSESTFQTLHYMQYPLIFLVLVGLFSRFACGGLLLLQGYVFFSDLQNFRNHPYFFLLVLLILMLSSADESFSLKALHRGMSRKAGFAATLLGPERPLAFQRMLQLQICLVYFLAGIHKLSGHFFGGHVTAFFVQGAQYHWLPWLQTIFGEQGAAAWQERLVSPEFQVIPSVMTIVLELGLPLALWSARLRPPAMIVGLAFHLGITFLMNIPTFSLAMIGSYVLFLDPGTVPRLTRRLFGGSTATR